MDIIFIITNGDHTISLGKIIKVLIQLRDTTITIDMIITNTASYNVLLRNNWLTKTKTVINYNAQKMKIVYQGHKFLIPLDLCKGVYPELQKDDDEEE